MAPSYPDILCLHCESLYLKGCYFDFWQPLVNDANMSRSWHFHIDVQTTLYSYYHTYMMIWSQVLQDGYKLLFFISGWVSMISLKGTDFLKMHPLDLSGNISLPCTPSGVKMLSWQMDYLRERLYADLQSFWRQTFVKRQCLLSFSWKTRCGLH